MTQTLRREARIKVEAILIPALSDNPQTQEAIDYAKELAEKCVDAMFEISGISKRTDEEHPEYKTKPAFDEDQADLSWSLLGGKKITDKQLEKQKAAKEFEDMLEHELLRLKLNWIAFDEKAKEMFRRFLKDDTRKGQELGRFVSWWLSDERRAANPPFTLGVIMQRWPGAFTGNASEQHNRPAMRKE